MRIQLLSWLLLIILSPILIGINTVVVCGQCLEDQKSLLLQMKNSLVFKASASTKLITWDQAVDCCRWSGVTCDSGGRVIGLDLSIESISDGIDSSTLFDLQYLQSLNLAYNRFNDTEISPRFGNLTNLTYLNFSNAGFSGQIPTQLSILTGLVILDLSAINYLFGNLPLTLENPDLRTLVQNLSSLEELHLDGVNISATGYEWCRALSSSLPNLRVLSLSDCNLSGPIDSSLAKLQFLTVIRLNDNNLSAPIPEFFANFRNLTTLRLSSSRLNGKFPGKIFQVPTLQSIDLADNGLLEGSLPEFVPQNSLQTIILSHTNFSGNLPESMGNLKRLSRIELANCNFSGAIPNSMGNLEQLVYLDFSVNGFNGSIPSFRLSKNLTQIVFSHNSLTGQILSEQWEGLVKLVNIDLSYNSLNGSIPLSLFSLPLLQKIQLSNNQFSGSLNGFPNVSSYQLNTLDLSINRLQGSIPTSLLQLRGLKFLSLSNNNFSETVDLSLLQNIKNLSTLDLSFNNLSISMSDNGSVLSALPQLTTLKLASCKLGVFPDMKNQSKLVTLDLSNNQIRGKIPSWLWNIGNGSLRQLNLSHNLLEDFEKPLPNRTLGLGILDLHSNRLQGQIPTLTSTTFLDYSNNNFSSVIPADIGDYISFAYFFSLSNNSITGSIPTSICNATYLLVLDLSYNRLNGIIPSCLFQRSENLGVLNLRRNNLTGNISDEFPSACNLKTLDFNGNQIDGSLPRSLANCTTLEVLDLGNNRIIDSFPCWLKSSSTLRVLILRSNSFYGSINCSRSASNLSMLQIIDLASNNLSGSLPGHCFLTWRAMMQDVDELQWKANHLRFEYLGLSRLYYQDTVTVTVKGLQLELVKILTVFTSIDFSSNSFDGIIPEEFGELKSLYVLNLSSNAFTGRIPSSLGNLSQLESLDLSQNELTGNIPIGLASLHFLSFLNLSFNQLVGKIPSGNQFQTFENTSYLGNTGLCGFPLSRSCPTGEGATPTVSPEYIDPVSLSSSGLDLQFILTGIGFGLGAGLVLAPLMFWKRGRKWYDKRVDALVSKILPFFGLAYNGYGSLWDNEEEDSETELSEFFRRENCDYDEDDDEDEEEEEAAIHGRYCVFCSKLDISRKMVIHNKKCTCHSSPTVSSPSSLSSSFSS